ncbi:hypothetical protein D3C85_1420380 [compost metagenome]
MRLVVQPRQALGLADGKTRAGQRRFGPGQPYHYIGADGLQGQIAVDRDDVQAHAGVAAQQRNQITPEDVVQDGFRHGQSNQGLLDRRQRAFVSQGNQPGVQLLPITSERQ